MVDITLNEEQLFELKSFIRKKGITENDVVNEILDHFACKTEEIMNQDFRIPFGRAMQMAHQSFGATGFRPMVVHYEKQIEKLVWDEFKSNLKQVICSPKIIGVILTSILLYTGLSLAHHHFRMEAFYDAQLFGLLALTLMLIGIRVYYFFKKGGLGDYTFDKKNLLLWQKKVSAMPKLDNFFWAFYFPFILGLIRVPEIFMILCCVLSFANMIVCMAKNETLQTLNKKMNLPI